MSFLQLLGFSAANRRSASSRSKTALSRKRPGIGRRRVLGFETMEGRWLLSINVNIDRSGDPSPGDTITVSTSGSNTTIVVDYGANQQQTYGPYTSTSISSLNITGSNYNDTIEFNYDGGNPVPDGTIGVSGGAGTNELTVTGNSNFTVGSDVQLFGNISSTISYGYIQKVIATAASPSDQVNLLAADSSAGVFYGHLQTGLGQGPGANYQANDGSYNNIALNFDAVNAISTNASDVAYLDDKYAGANNATAHPTVSWFQGNNLSDTATSFAQVHFSSGDSQDGAYLDDQNNSNAASANYGPLYATFSGPGYSYSAASFGYTKMTGYNSADSAALTDTGTQGAFTSYNTDSYVTGTDNGASYNGSAYFAKVYLNAAQNTDTSNWFDYAGGVNVALNQYTQAYIVFANGASVTDIGFGRYSYTATITAYNYSNPVKVDYATASSAFLVNFEPSDTPNNTYWYLNPNE